jgi:hypothetical protein
VVNINILNKNHLEKNNFHIIFFFFEIVKKIINFATLRSAFLAAYGSCLTPFETQNPAMLCRCLGGIH